MKKRVLSLLLVCSMILSMSAGLSVTAFAADAESDFIMDDKQTAEAYPAKDKYTRSHHPVRPTGRTGGADP